MKHALCALRFWFGAGIVAYAVAMTFHGSIWIIRLFKEAKSPPVIG